MSKETANATIEAIGVGVFNHSSFCKLTHAEISDYITSKGFRSEFVPRSDPRKYFHQVFITYFDYLREIPGAKIPDWLTPTVTKINLPKNLE